MKVLRTPVTCLAFLCFVASADTMIAQQDPLAVEWMHEQFLKPPQQARPQVWWHWMSGNVTWEGAKLDLEWMHRVGIGGVGAFSGGGSLEKTYVNRPLTFMSPGWADAYRKSLSLAKSFDMDFMIAGSPGWSETGGPWVAPANGMKKYTWSETVLEPGKPGPIILPAAPSATGPFQGVARGASLVAYDGVPHAHGAGPVIAFAISPSDTAEISTVRSNNGLLPQAASLPPDLSKEVEFPVDSASGAYLDISLVTKSKVAGVTIAADTLPGFVIRCMDCSNSSAVIGRFLPGDVETPSVQQTVTFDPVVGTKFRIEFDPSLPAPRLPGLPARFEGEAPVSVIHLRQLRFLGDGHVDHFESKAGFQTSAIPDAFPSSSSSGSSVIPSASVIDISSRLHGDVLDWNPPPGRWMIVRFGWSLTGMINEPAEQQSTGLEVDKLDAAAVQQYIDTLIGEYKNKAHVQFGAEGINALLTDSWETGPQNWSNTLIEDFRRLRGYDPMPWLPVLTGRIVESAQKSDAFLYDFRQTLNDLVVQNHFDVLRKTASQNGMTYYTENQGDTPRAMGNGMTVKAHADVPTGELWLRAYNASKDQPALVTDLREAASGAHVYGKRLVGAETFTVAAGEDPWSFSPGDLKVMADEEFGLGVNRILLHESHMQPFVDKKPGLELGFYGIYFNRNETWAEKARPFIDYLARSSFLLQQGYAVNDIAYIYGEDKNLTEIFHFSLNDDVPRGYGYDYLNTEGLNSHIRVVDGAVQADSGTRYQLLYLSPHANRLQLSTLRRLAEIVSQGAILVGKRPIGSLGMDGSQVEFDKMCNDLWGSSPGTLQPITFGKGKVYPTDDLSSVLVARQIVPDVGIPLTYDVLTQHRHTPDSDIYYLVNQSETAQDGWVQFRVSGLVPQLWSAKDGSTKPLSYRSSGEVTSVRVPLQPREAAFIVFSGATWTKAFTAPVFVLQRSIPVRGPWRVDFETGRGAPPTAVFAELQDWSRSTNAGIRYFSGTAKYQTTFDLPLGAQAGKKYALDLGEVAELATVRVNHKAVATLWTQPFATDISSFLKPGKNILEIEVINSWVNRLIGDQQANAPQFTYAPQSPYTVDSPLKTSGFLGPVRILEMEERPSTLIR